MRPAVLLDRDDTINVNADLPDAAWRGTPGDLLDPAHTHLIDGAEHAIRQLKDAGYAIVIITNQGGVARGHGDVRDIDAVNDRLRQLLPHDPLDADTAPPPIARGLIDACYACPHHPAGVVSHFADNHAWRKPNPGMVSSAIAELRLDPNRSWMVGDKQRDLDAALAAGIAPERSLLIGPGKDIPDLAAATEIILKPPPMPRVLAASRVVLHADLSDDPRPLADERVRETVIASARAIAERTGVELLDASATDTALTATLAASRVAAMGFAAELRRVTNAWHTKRNSRALWLDRSE